MAPFGLSSRQSGWGQAASGGRTNGSGGLNIGGRGPIATAGILLFIGAIIGFGLASVGGDGSPTASSDLLIPYSVEDIEAADKTEAGAIKAATALLIGLPELSVRPAETVDAVLTNNLVVPEQNPDVRPAVEEAIEALRVRLLPSSQNGVGSPIGTAKILVVPAAYRARVIDDNNITVQIWRLSLYLESSGAVAQGVWTTDDVGLVWDGEQWRVAGYGQTLGPTPPLYSPEGAASNYADIQTVLNNAFAYRPALAGA